MDNGLNEKDWNERLKISLKESDLIKQILPNIVFNLVVLLLGICVDLSHEFHLTPKYDIWPHYLFYYPSFYRLVNALTLYLCQLLIFRRTWCCRQWMTLLTLVCLQLPDYLSQLNHLLLVLTLCSIPLIVALVAHTRVLLLLQAWHFFVRPTILRPWVLNYLLLFFYLLFCCLISPQLGNLFSQFFNKTTI